MGFLGRRCVGESRKAAKSNGRSVPLDVISNILSRLPTRSAVRFGCVSRNWLDLVTRDRYFQQEQYRRSLTETPHIAALSREDDKGCITFNLSRGSFVPPMDTTFGHILTSRPLAFCNACNGVLCFVAPLDGSVLLCNPITGQILTLPEFSTHTASSIRYRHSAALGFIPSTNEYKVVRSSYSYNGDDDDDDSHLVIAEVYSLDSPNSHWRLLPCCEAPYPPDRKTVYFQGKLHWIHRNRIVTFDVAREEFIAAASTPNFGPQSVLLELNGRLSLVDASSHTQVEVWVLLQVGCWHKVCVLCAPVSPQMLDPKLHRLLNMWERNGRLLLRLQDKWISYGLETKTQNKLMLTVGGVTRYEDWEICHGYRASLVSLMADGYGNNSSSSSGWASFYRDLGTPPSPLRITVGHSLEIMDMAVRLLPQHESTWTSSWPTIRMFHQQIQADIHSDRRTLGPHSYPTPKQPPSKEDEIAAAAASTNGLAPSFKKQKLKIMVVVIELTS